jgi:hypothetical protein
MVGRRCRAADVFLRQRVADFETFRQVTEQGGAFPGQNPGQRMSHEHQDEFAILKLAPPKRLFPLAPPNGERAGERGF